jgi:hypothetical protein
LVALLSGGSAAPEAQKTPPPQAIRLYLFTAPAPPKAKEADTEESDLKERVQATKDITTWLVDKKRKTVSVVDKRELADAIVEITAVQHAPGMTLSERTAGYMHGPQYETWTVRATVTAGAFTNELSRRSQFPSLAAEMVADDIEKWTSKNRDKLIAARPK